MLESKAAYKQDTSSVKPLFSGVGANYINFKANFHPVSFGKYRKVEEVWLMDKDTLMPVIASISKEKIGDFVSAKIYVNRKEVGHMDMDCPARDRDYNNFYSNLNRKTCEINHLRSLAGDKYKGIGTALVKFAIKESIKSGCEGRICLFTAWDFEYGLSKYRSKESPIPFYDKLGFVAIDPEENKKIKKILKDGRLEDLEDTAMYLSEKAALILLNKK